ncbi:hypothetical protein GCM10011609_86150 [Lentzea pudingi]|uniref:DUF397 domain-containing protein n=1 Tax=Lentzea pudingi TaxID=1789439 RepID=A0ABQ2IU41_9PSEU|nr:DUF397 domain-containing protein [Lentzea pudingi]GGN29258.1 hypothetical protein GCM10011609_86150 [Lentzea pudingi]
MNTYDPHAVAALFSARDWERPDACAGKHPSACGDNGGNCIEINLGTDGIVGMRDSKLQESPILIFTDEEWAVFLQSARAGKLSR